jgi:hypothetical protein
MLRPIRPLAEPLDVSGYDLRDNALKLRQVLGCRLWDEHPHAGPSGRRNRLILHPARAAPPPPGRAPLLGQDILGKIVCRDLHTIGRQRLGGLAGADGARAAFCTTFTIARQRRVL